MSIRAGKHFHSVPPPQCCLFARVLEEAVLQMRIIDGCNSFLSVTKTLDDLPTLRALKFGVSLPPPTDTGAAGGRESGDIHHLDQLFTNRQTLWFVIIYLYKELTLFKTFKGLVKIVESMAAEAIDSNAIGRLTSDRDRLRCTKSELAKQRRHQRNGMRHELYETDELISKLKNELEDSLIFRGCRERYVDHYQSARAEQKDKIIKNKETHCCSTIEYFKYQNENELRAHSEVEMLLSININETHDKIMFWMEKYDRDIENIDIKIHLKNNNYEIQMEKNKELKDKIDKRAKEIEVWNAFCVAREEIRRHNEKMTNAAIAVQAWWRGLMVRQQLGPYKPKKKKATKKPNGKK